MAKYKGYLKDKSNNQLFLSDNYSSEEQVIGTWIDGKPLYRKVINCTYQSTAGTAYDKAFSTNITNMSQLVNAYGCAKFGDRWLPLNFINRNIGGWNSFHVTSNGATIQVHNDGTYPTSTIYIILEYTKTTD